jgi:hypothetical protein
LESRPIDDDVEPRDAVRSNGFGVCFKPSKPSDADGFFLGGFVIRLPLLAERFVSLYRNQSSEMMTSDGDVLYNVCDMSIFTFGLSFYTC